VSPSVCRTWCATCASRRAPPEADREQAAYERGRLDGEKALNERLMQQRNELLELQQGVLKSLQQAVPQVMRDCEQALTALASKWRKSSSPACRFPPK